MKFKYLFFFILFFILISGCALESSLKNEISKKSDFYVSVNKEYKKGIFSSELKLIEKPKMGFVVFNKAHTMYIPNKNFQDGEDYFVVKISNKKAAYVTIMIKRGDKGSVKIFYFQASE